MKYKIVQAGNVEGLEKEVNKLLAEGWKPIGGIHSLSWKVSNATYWAICQAMTKEE
jgi:hypothetical protein